MAYKNLSELTTGGQTWTIKVKVIRIWDSINPSTDELISIDMILMDEQVSFNTWLLLLSKLVLIFSFCSVLKGDTIHATIWKNMTDTYRSKINENFVYVISNFKVVESTKYRPVSNEIKITFVYNTKVKEMKGALDKFSDYYFEFASKSILQDRKEKDKQCSGMFIVVLLSSRGFYFIYYTR
jgi:hypothetical protein